MNLTSGDITLILIYFVIVFAIGWWVKKRESAEDYLIAGRKVGLFQTAASMLAVLGGLVIVGQAALAFDLGIAAIWFWVGLALGIVCIGLAAKKIKGVADKGKFLTISDYVFEKFGNKAGYVSAIILFLAFLALLTGQFIAGGSLFAPLLGVNYATAVLILGFGTLIYLLLGGFKAVIKTDLLQFILMFIVFVFLLFTIDIGNYTPDQMQISSIGGFAIITFLAMGIFSMFGAADYWQRLFSSRDYKTARKASYLTAALFVIFGVALTIVGIAAKNNFPDIASNEALYYGFFQLLPQPLLGLAVVVILAAIMSTIDTELFVLASSIAKDFSHRRKSKTDKEMQKIIRISLVGLALISMLVAIFVSDVLLVLFSLVSLILCVSPTIIASLFWKIKSKAVILSMLAGVISFLVLFIMGQLTPDTSAITLPTSIIFLIIGQIIFRK